ncbi:phage holin family protein [Nesterenkonia sp. LB17]|uniref:phage holin family protein n=1 Tax=unclassified Nesterenkonia TaxID=2629769 RepID=UPI001F4C9E54|nr:MULTISPECIES: phage holin family protein [unclassified Nesterenkonia]MCH8562814.1 phage holin family protein [Nesterenkonia sp. YGD6]MCH8565863.1 phage holin family protein [Nesterenkonia sp. LB17]
MNTTPERPGEHSPTHPTTPLPPEPADVDELLAESLRAQSEQDFAWKEPERGPRWFERAEQEAALAGGTTTDPDQARDALTRTTRDPGGMVSGAERSPRSGHRQGPRIGGAVYAAVAIALALWVLASVVLGIHIEPLIVALGVCSLAGLALVGAGLRPKPGQRI